VPGGGGDRAYVIYMHIRSIPAETGIQCFLPYSKNSNNRTRDGTLELPLLVRVGSFFFFSSLKLSLVKIFTKVPYLRHSYYTGSEEKESFCLKIVGRYGS